jgi:hypothetical protein
MGGSNPTWAATSVPVLRRQWCNALAATIQWHSQALKQLPPTDTITTDTKSFERLKTGLADTLAFVQAEADALRAAQLYWVSRDMVELAVAASKTLPPWTPAEAAPAPSGLLCWAKPAGTVPYGKPTTATTNVAWDAVWWWTRSDGFMQLQSASRFRNDPELLASYKVRTPLGAASTIFMDPRIPRTEEAHGSEDMHPFISVVGAAWLLMAQPNITETRTTELSKSSERLPSGAEDTQSVGTPEPSSVTIIELRRNLAQSKTPAAKRSNRQYRGRWLVGWPNGYWRQQSYGPGRSLRKPILIAPHTAGPKGAALIPSKERVYVWRR